MKYRYPRRSLTYPVGRKTRRARSAASAAVRCSSGIGPSPRGAGRGPSLADGRPASGRGGPRSSRDPRRGQSRAGSLTGAVHLSKGNAGVPRRARRGRKPRVE